MIRESTEVSRGPLAAALHAAWTVAGRRRRVATALAAAVFLALCGAFGSGRVPLGRRLLFWVLAMVLGSAVTEAIERVLTRRARRGPALLVGMTIAISAPVTLVVWVLSGWLLDDGWQLAALPGLVVPVLTVTAAMVGISAMTQRQPAMTHAAAAPAAVVRPRLLDRLPAGLRGGVLLAVEAEDHYLRLHTTRGSDLILLRLADAIAELDGIEGAQTHRSWWVARAAVTQARRAEGRATLVLPGGIEAPVSRTYARALREAGWFEA